MDDTKFVILKNSEYKELLSKVEVNRSKKIIISYVPSPYFSISGDFILSNNLVGQIYKIITDISKKAEKRAESFDKLLKMEKDHDKKFLVESFIALPWYKRLFPSKSDFERIGSPWEK